MFNDASAAAASPMTNGTSPSAGHREADASTTPPSASTTSLAEVCADLNQRVTNFLAAEPVDEVTKQTQEQTRISIGVIGKALQEYDFDALSLSYNGGKDCLVLLILYLSTLHTYFTSANSTHKAPSHSIPTSIPSIYAKPPDPFEAVTSFVESSSREYHLSLTHISTNPGKHPKAKSHTSPPASPEKLVSPSVANPKEKIVSFRDAFALYLSSHPAIRAIFVGTRRTDPHGAHLGHFNMTDGNWPRFMRIHPVIDWHLSEIWTFLRSPYLADAKAGKNTLEYCAMYDQGYTSLGGVGDTLRNPKLRYYDPKTGEEKYKPAYALTEDGEERLGRE